MHITCFIYCTVNENFHAPGNEPARDQKTKKGTTTTKGNSSKIIKL